MNDLEPEPGFDAPEEVEALQQKIGESLIALRRCVDAGVPAGDAVRACGIPWPAFADVSLDMMVEQVPLPAE